MTATLDLTTVTPAAIDTAWAEAVAPFHAKLDRIASTFQHLAGMEKRVQESGKDWAYGYSLERITRERATANEQRDELRAQLAQVEAPFQAQWDARGGWTRAFKVTNGNGHIHSSMSCSTCNNGQRPTQFAWITELSGHTTDEIAELAGEAACTVCYPNAPVKPCEIFTKDEKAKAADKAAREAKRAAKAAKDAAAAITHVDGQPLREQAGNTGSVIKTERTARMYLTDAIWWGQVRFNNNPENKARHAANAQHLAEAISFKTGETVEEIMAAHLKKARKR